MRAQLSGKIRAWLATPSAKAAGLTFRKYQSDAAADCYRLLKSGKNVVLPLPTGTGKTLIANLVVRLWVDARPKSRVLLVAPRRILVSQHIGYTSWMGDAVECYHLSDYTIQSPVRFAANSANSQLLIVTPELFANTVRSGLLRPFLKAVDLVLVDEFDEFLLPEFTAEGCDCRFDIAFQNALSALPKARFLLMSATAPPARKDSAKLPADVRAASEYVQEIFKPSIVLVPEGTYSAHVPVTKLILRNVHDSVPESLDAAVSDEISMLLTVLEDLHTGKVDRQWVMSRIDGLADGRILRVRSKGGKLLPIPPNISKLFQRVRHFHYLRSFVYEDMCRGLCAEHRELTTVTDPVSGERVSFQDKFRLTGLSSGFEHHPHLCAKANVAIALTKTRSKVVVLFRYLRLLNAIGERLTGLKRTFAELHGDMNDRQREAALDAFRHGSQTVLLMTRDTGKRGLDLPQAHTAVFYSPKASESSTFQEASRIRSTTSHVKDCTILCYGGTQEREKLLRLIDQIASRADRDYRISERDFRPPLLSQRDDEAAASGAA